MGSSPNRHGLKIESVLLPGAGAVSDYDRSGALVLNSTSLVPKPWDPRGDKLVLLVEKVLSTLQDFQGQLGVCGLGCVG